MPQHPTPPESRLHGEAAGRAAVLDGRLARRRRALLASPVAFLGAVLLHAAVLAFWLSGSGAASGAADVEVLSTVVARPLPPPEPEAPVAPEPIQPVEPLAPAAPAPEPQALDRTTDVAPVDDEDPAPGPVDDTRPAGPDVFGVGSSGGGGGGGTGTGRGGRRSGLGGGAPGAADIGPMGSGFRDFVDDLRGRAPDAAFGVDVTASMQHFIDSARATIDDIIGDLSTIVPDLRIGLVAYRDQTDGWTTQHVALTDDRYRIHNFLLDMEAAGGGDFEEAVEEGLKLAVEVQPWRPGCRRVIIVVGDAPPHPDDESAALGLARSFAHDGRSVVDVLYTGTEPDKRRPERETQARTVLERIARSGGGRLEDLRGDAAGLRSLIVDAAFGDEYRQDIRTFLARDRTDWRQRIVQDRIRRGELAWMLEQLGSEPVHPSIVEGCLQLFDKAVARRALALLLDESVAGPVRSTALYLLKSKVAPGLALDVGRPLAEQAASVAKLQREVDKLPEPRPAVVLPPLPAQAAPTPPPKR